MSVMNTQPRASTFALAVGSLIEYRPEKKVYRVGEEYPYTDIGDSLPSALCAFLTAHYRIAHPGKGAVRRFPWWWVRDRIGILEDAIRVIPLGVPLEEPLYEDERWHPSALYVRATSVSEIATAIQHHGPVVLHAFWPGRFDRTSTELGVEWVGTDGRNAVGPYYAEHRRAVLLKGVSYRYGAIRVQDEDNVDRWLSFPTLRAMLAEGADTLGAFA
jgi:hypothetical protein